MTRIDNNQQLIAIVRQQLERASKAKIERTPKVAPSTSKEVTGAKRLSQLEGFNEDELSRALVESILTEEFGEGLINEAQFQQIVDKITKQLKSDGESAKLISDTLLELKNED